MKKVILLLTLILATLLITSCGKKDEEIKDVVTLNVYNWGEYIADGFEGGYDTNAAFEKYFNENLAKKYGYRIEVNYTTYDTNENMYSKLSSGAGEGVYDVIFPSDYMLQRMADEGLLYEFNVAERIPNYANIDDNFKGLDYDPEEKYSVPYTYGMVGIIYNPTLMNPEDLNEEGEIKDKSWSLLWNKDYAGKILQFNNPRDAFATAMLYHGIDINTADKDEWQEALGYLKEQKGILQGYVNDEIFNKMTSASAAIAPYFAGDYITMSETEGAVPLEFYYPTEGVNYFVDAMCIPKSSKNPEVAKEYINFMLSEEPAVENAKYIGYASPNTLVSSNADYLDFMGEDACEILYGTNPKEINAAYNDKHGTTCYKNFTPEIQSRVNTLWENLKLADSTELWVHLLSGGIVIAIVALAVYTTYVKKKRSRAYRLRDKQARLAKQAK